MSHPARMRFWGRMADLLGLGRVTFRADEAGGWFAYAEKVEVPHVARGKTAADALKELVVFGRRVKR